MFNILHKCPWRISAHNLHKNFVLILVSVLQTGNNCIWPSNKNRQQGAVIYVIYV